MGIRWEQTTAESLLEIEGYCCPDYCLRATHCCCYGHWSRQVLWSGLRHLAAAAQDPILAGGGQRSLRVTALVAVYLVYSHMAVRSSGKASKLEELCRIVVSAFCKQSMLEARGRHQAAAADPAAPLAAVAVSGGRDRSPCWKANLTCGKCGR